MDNQAKPGAVAAQVPMLIAGEWVLGDQRYEDRDPYRGDLVATAPESSRAEVDRAIAAAVEAKSVMAAMPGFERARMLRKVGQLLDERVEDIAGIMAREMGKAITDARAEVSRSQDTISLSAEEAIRIQGEHVPLDGSAMGAGKIAFLLRFPVGVVGGITPFNAPFNLACHKVGPALAAGNSVVLKAPPQTPLVVHKMVELFVDAGVPKGALNVVYGSEAGPMLVRDPRVDVISFTGSSRVGAEIKSACGMKRVALELGGNGATIVHHDAEIGEVAAALARNSMRIGGQSCISVQNVFVHRQIFAELRDALVEKILELQVGDPLDESTDLGTLIDEDAAIRVEQWVREAVADGAQLLTGGGRAGAQIEPTVLCGVQPRMKVVCEEVFGPVVSLLTYEDLQEPIDWVNAGPYGLHTGIYTKNLDNCFRAIRTLKVGGVIINGTSTWRTDQLPYGGVKASGLGREGPHYAMRDMTEERLVVFNL